MRRPRLSFGYVARPPAIGETQRTVATHGPGMGPLGHIGGQVDPHYPEIGPDVVVNPREFGITGWGDDNQQQFQSSHTNALPTNQSAELGRGVGPERQWPHYPSPDNPNPYRDGWVMRRNGGDAYSALIYRPEAVAYWAQAQQAELQWAAQKQTFTGRVAVVNQAPTTPFVNTVPPLTPGGY